MGWCVKLKLGLLSAVVVTLSACGGSGGGSTSSNTTDACSKLDNDTFNCSQMLTDIVEHAVRPSTTALSAASVILHDNTDTYCAAIGEANEDASLTSAKNAWSAAMVEVQQLRAMQFGPLADSETGLDAIYAWPTVSSCLVDSQVKDGEVGLANRAGLYAMEYLLFGPVDAVSCENGELPSVDAWAEGKSSDQIQIARCDYAKLVADDLVLKTSALATTMNNYDLASLNENLQTSAGLVSDALFYIDKQTKDVKIKKLLPQAGDETFNPEEVESQFAHVTQQHIKSNLQGMRKVFTADSNMGLDDYLAAASQQEIADDMLAAIDATIDNINALSNNTDASNDSLFDIVSAGGVAGTCVNLGASGTYDNASSDIDTLCALQFTIKQVTDLLKGEYTQLTSFAVPATAGGDAD